MTAGVPEVAVRPRLALSLRTEAGWVLLHKFLELGVNVLTLKVLTTLLRDTPAVYGEINLVLTATVLVANVVLLPANQTYLRKLHAAHAKGELAELTSFVLRWYLWATAAVAVACTLWSRPIAERFGLEPLMPLAAGLVFLAGRWRSLAIDVLEIGRQRRAWTLQNVAFLGAQLVAMSAALSIWHASTTAALLAYAAAAGGFALVGVWPLVAMARGVRHDRTLTFMPLVVAYGVPAAVLLLLQSVQGFADRYVLGMLTDLDTVGRYVAAYQVAGVPYMLLMGALQALCVPIAFQRARDAGDPRQLWAGDRVILAGVLGYVACGVLGLGAFMLWGERVLRWCTAAEFAVPWSVLVMLALGRFLQGLSLLLQNFFAVHQLMATSMGFRLIGAAVALPICWIAIRNHGMEGAAVASAVGVLVYGVLLSFGPGGCFWLVRDAQRRTGEARFPVMAAEGAA